jgi:dTDP-glucose 4,6-dehydratase
MKRLLVTGAAGFIGSNFVHHRLARGGDERIVAFDALTYAGNRANLAAADGHSAFRFVRGDICDGDLVRAVMAEERIDCIVHFAAESHVDRSISGPDAFVRTNVIGTHELLKAARHAWGSGGRMRDDVRFHHVSTDEVYGSLSADDPAFVETTPYAPNSPYSASKAASDHLVRAYHHTYGLPVTTSNCSNNYGPFHFPEKLIPLMLVRALTGGELPVYGKGENVRDWLYVEDHCAAISVILEKGRIGETYNVGGGNEKRNIDIVRLLCALVDGRFGADARLRERFPQCPAAAGRCVDTLIRYVTDRPGHDWRYAIDAGKLARELGFRPAETFESGIAKTVDWYLANESWWRAVLSGEYRTR